MELIKLLPLLFVAAQGEARAIHHQQLLPAIPGYVPVYIQQGPDVEVIYETGRKVAVQDSEKPFEEKPEEAAAPQKVEESQQAEDPKKSEEQPSQQQIAERPQAEEVKEQEVEDKKPTVVEHKPESEEQNNVNPSVSSSSMKTGSGIAVLVPGYKTSEVAEK